MSVRYVERLSLTINSSLAEYKTIHTGEKPYECNICEKAFTERGQLAEHKKFTPVKSHMHVKPVKRISLTMVT